MVTSVLHPDVPHIVPLKTWFERDRLAVDSFLPLSSPKTINLEKIRNFSQAQLSQIRMLK